MIDRKEHLRVLITCPNLRLGTYTGGGVFNYYSTIKNHFSIKTDYFEVGALRDKESTFKIVKHLFNDMLRFYHLLNTNMEEYDIIQINPSFFYKSIVRDGLLLRIAKRSNKRTLVFIRGWDENLVRIVEKYLFPLFFSTYNKADAFIVLASDFKMKMQKWGFKQPIYVETTLVDDKLVRGFSIKERINKIDSEKPKQILFLSRIEKEKGICETIEAFQKLSERYPDLHLVVAGDGPFKDEAFRFVNRLGMQGEVSFLGHIKGSQKREVFMNSDIYVLPTYFGEGMPNAVLEAMAFGLPVVTRPVGGLKDFFIDGHYGYITESKDPSVIASLIEKIICNKDLQKKISIKAYEYARERFMASKVAKRLENIYERTLSGNANAMVDGKIYE